MSTVPPTPVPPAPASARGTLAEQAGTILRASREAAGISRRALAAQHGINDSNLVDLEFGRLNPTLKRLGRIAREVYGVELVISATQGSVGAAVPRPM